MPRLPMLRRTIRATPIAGFGDSAPAAPGFTSAAPDLTTHMVAAESAFPVSPAVGGPLVAPVGTPDTTGLPRGPIKLVAIDLDGTLLNEQKAISPRNHRALLRVINRGVAVILATARPPRSVKHYYEALRLRTPQVNYNGALIWDERMRRVVAHTPLAVVQSRKIIDFARKQFKDILVSVEILDRWYTDHYSEMPEYATETSKDFAPDFIGPLNAFLTVPATKIMFLAKPERIAVLEEKIAAKFGGTVAHTRSDPHLLQVMAHGVNKGVALRRVAWELNIDLADAMAIGDAANDLEMLGAVGWPVAMGNAWPVVRQMARATTADNEHDGVAEALERFVLTKGAGG